MFIGKLNLYTWVNENVHISYVHDSLKSELQSSLLVISNKT